MKIPAYLSFVLAALFAPISQAADPSPPADGPRVQLAILLDTSGSMEGLIQQAKTQLWKIVNEFISARQNGQTPFVEVALYEYGNDGIKKGKNWVRQIQPLTRDLDKVSQELFALRTNGGEEYCGAAIQRAMADLAWDSSTNTYKAIFIAGNEPFTQGPVDVRESCKTAIAKGVIVNSIHCGNEKEGRDGQWHTGPALADGKFMNIDQNQAVAHVEAPQDAEIAKLNEELNHTYVWYGRNAEMKRQNQAAQDANAFREEKSGAAVQRAAAKASANYYQADADLVDAAKEKSFDLAKVKEEELPAEMKSLKPEERQAYVEGKAKQRADIQKKILDLTKQRETYVAEKMKAEGKKTLDTAVAEAIREQAGKKRITWEK